MYMIVLLAIGGTFCKWCICSMANYIINPNCMYGPIILPSKLFCDLIFDTNSKQTRAYSINGTNFPHHRFCNGE